ncbi:adenosylcobinamide-phosphate synthase CbiB [Vreelandella olivaria]|uniref:adenosylcobinamide-phosphate synthase CbiB n=1 Tax=Vreelandella olivaria TaxID=390919 RepID=UPI00201EA6FC|nr:adenosylcobinamide-phosphate synthase CbiB [Halomonas olivaria]
MMWLSDYLTTALCMVAVAIVIDLVVGDPRSLPHPVVMIGHAISTLEKRWNQGSQQRRRLSGFMLTTTTVLGTFAVAWWGLALLTWLHPWLGLMAELWLLATALAIKGLAEAGRAIAVPLAQGDFPAARRALSMVVGRDTEQLDEAEITRGAVETIAENSVDGITAPLFFALLGGAPLALAYKAINTLDSMVGHRNSRFNDFGYASAKLDDIANWLPARLTALCLWGAGIALNCIHQARFRWQGALTKTCQQAPRHPSPNAGWPEAMVANLLGVQLGGTNVYQGTVSHRATLGSPREPLKVVHIDRAIRLMHGAWLLFFLLMACVFMGIVTITSRGVI